MDDLTNNTRRTFLRDAALVSGAAVVAGTTVGSLSEALAQTTPDWKKQIGLELFTVRDAMQKDYEGVLAKIASYGYKEIEPASGYNNLSAKEFRAMTDRYGLSVPSTHSGLPAGDTIEARLEGAQIMGFKYVENFGGAPGGTGRGASGAGRGPGGPPPGGRGPGAGPTTETVKRQAQTLNENGKVAKKFGIKMIVHNHAGEFALLSDNHNLRPYDILLAETDPDVVAMQLDIGWASVAGQDIIAMFKKNPGRFECWHVKDATNIKFLPPAMPQNERMQNAYPVPVGQGQVDYKTIFASAAVAGMKHFCIEQDNADAWGDSVLAAKASIIGLQKILS
jgi:sugar phosphate isomerase/epimerase